MPWIYHQSTGELYHNDKRIAAKGYSGKLPWQNHPEFQSMEGKGPIPRGKYSIGAPFRHPATGLYSMRLTPAPSNNMFGRVRFLIHGANGDHPLDSSDGCIVLAPEVRAQIWTSGDHQLEVVQ